MEDWARFGGPCMEQWIQNWDIQEQEVDPVTVAVTSELDKVIHSSWFSVRHCQLVEMERLISSLAPRLGGILEKYEC